MKKLGYYYDEYGCGISDKYINDWEEKLNKVLPRLAILRGRKQKLEQYIKELNTK